MSRDFSTRPDPYTLVELLRECAVQDGDARANAARLTRYAAEYLGPLLDAVDRAKGTLISAEYHIKNGSWEQMQANAINAIDTALATKRSVQ